MSLHVYGVLRASHPMLATVSRPVVWQDLAAIASELPADHQPTERELLAHLDLLSALVAVGPVVPLRFGTVVADEQAVRASVLAPTGARLRAHLDRLDGVAEVHVYLRFEEDAGLRAVFSATPAWPGMLDRAAHRDLKARIRLGETVAARLVDWRRARSDTLLAPISAVALESTALPERAHAEDRRAFLVPVAELPTVLAAVDELDQRTDVTADCVGPLPAYSFLGDLADAGRPAPAGRSRWGW